MVKDQVEEVLTKLIPPSTTLSIPGLNLSMVNEYENLYGLIDGLEYFLEEIIKNAKVLFMKELNLISNEEFQKIIDSIWKEKPALINDVGRKILEAYYRNSSVLESLGFYSGPLNKALDVTQTQDLDVLLSQVTEKGPIYRTL